MPRGGYRLRWFRPGPDVYYVHGRWGPRHLRIHECWAVIRAEDAYASFIRTGSPPAIGSRVMATADIKGQQIRLAIEILPNRLWPLGRTFFRCGRCERRITRLFIPAEGRDPRCRHCWQLNYQSQEWSYRATCFLGPRWPSAYSVGTHRLRIERKRELRKRYAQRRRLLKRLTRGQTQRTDQHVASSE